jgi:hypothetical protein
VDKQWETGRLASSRRLWTWRASFVTVRAGRAASIVMVISVLTIGAAAAGYLHSKGDVSALKSGTHHAAMGQRTFEPISVDAQPCSPKCVALRYYEVFAINAD